MFRLRWALLLLAVGGFSLESHGQESLARKVATKLSQKSSLTGKFEQKRTVNGLKMDFFSSGHFEIGREIGLKWIQDKPFSSLTHLTSTKLETQGPDNQLHVVTEKENPYVFTFTKVFLNLFWGKMDGIAELFNVTASGSETDWRLDLSPKSEMVKKAILEIHVFGSQTIRRLELKDAQGNRIEINLTVSG